MFEAFREGGWPMLPTSVCGLALLFATLRYAMRPDSRLVPLQIALTILTVSMGALGFVAGVTRSFTHLHGVAADRAFQIGAVGVGQSLHSMGLALTFVVVSAIAVTIGAARRLAAA